MTDGRDAARRPARTPPRQRSGRRWAVVGGVAASWVVLALVMGSAVSATVLLAAMAGLGAAAVGGLRALGVTRDHPWIRRLAVPPGRYRLPHGDPVSADPEPDLSYAWYADVAPEFGGGMATIMERSLASVPVLRLVTGSSVAETTTSGARAGRGPVELVLPDVRTVSREHARFSFCDGRWWITNQGRNGLTVNGTPVTGEQPLGDGDAIRWGTRPDALLSRVEIG